MSNKAYNLELKSALHAQALAQTAKPLLYFRRDELKPWNAVASPTGTYGKYGSQAAYAQHLQSKGFITRIGE